MKSIRTMAAAMLLVGGGLTAQLALAQPTGLGRTDVLKHDLDIPGREVVQVRVDLDHKCRLQRMAQALVLDDGACVYLRQ
jgi:hypothetical protein